MRTALAILTIVGAARVAAADVDRRCYAGTESMELDGKTDRHAIVVVRELDRSAGEIREQSWSDVHSDEVRQVVFKVDAKNGTFTFDDNFMRGAAGTLDGAPWKWTAYHAKLARDGIEIATDGELRGPTLAITTTFSQNGRSGGTQRRSATAFDCKELDRRRRALDPMSSKTAVRTCYTGTATSSEDGKQHPVTLVQIIDRTRIELRERIGDAKHDRVSVLTVEGDKAMVNGMTPAQLTGRPGAWTGYSWTDSGIAMTVVAEGTLGGAHATKKQTITGAGSTYTIAIDAKSVDCPSTTAAQP